MFFEEEPLGVGALPEEEIRGAVFAGGPDDEIDIGELRVVEEGAKRGFIDSLHVALRYTAGLLCVILSAVRGGERCIEGWASGTQGDTQIAIHCPYHFILPPVIEGEVKREVRIVLRLLCDFFECLGEIFGNTVRAAGVEEAGALLCHVSAVFANVTLEETHELCDFLWIAFPVFRGEAPDSENSNAWVLPAPVRERAEVLDGFCMSIPWVEILRACPTAVAIGDEGKVEFLLGFRHGCRDVLLLFPGHG